MFGFKLQSGGCGCGCGTSGCIQQKQMVLETYGAASCGDMANAIDFINDNFDTLSPLSLAWAAHPAGWQYYWSGEMDSPSDTTPDPTYTSTGQGALTSDEEYPNSSLVAGGGAATGAATRVSFLLPDSTVQIVGTWYSSVTGYGPQQSCVMAGVATGCGYVFNVPIPPPSLCVAGPPVYYYGTYTVFPNSNLGGFFPDYVWSDFAAACAASPSTCFCSTSPGPCMSGDPFFGDDP
jgi:hypothetical protein